jgi:exodeoxyribonuclease VII large subunit
MNNPSNIIDMTEVVSVSELNRKSKNLLELNIGLIWISGEISNLAKPASGHCYFSLKDSNAQVRAACFKRTYQQIDFKLENGQEVIVQARVSLYEPRGDYQIIAQNIILAGDGLLQLKFNQLKKKCENKGMFATANKKPLPDIINTIGLITSATGAALQDMLKVLRRRSPLISVIVYPTVVQGKAASEAICQAINTANQRCECEALVLARGGGSLEDLWCFNEEIVAQTIFDNQLPLVTGVGHETDITIADLCADIRAATPSAAAELISPNQVEQLEQLKHSANQIHLLATNHLDQCTMTLKHLQTRLRHPQDRLNEVSQTIDQLEIRIQHAMNLKISNITTHIENNAKLLHTLSPLSTLSRGYSITRNAKNNIIDSSSGLLKGDTIKVNLSCGEIIAEVISTEDNSSITTR